MFQTKPFSPTDEAYEALAAVEKAIWPDNFDTVADFKHADANRDPAYLYQRLVVEEGGQILAFALYRETAWAYEAGRIMFGIYVHPDYEQQGIGTAVYNHILDNLNQRQEPLRHLITLTKEDKAEAIRFLQKRGFEQTMRWIVSILNVQEFDAAPFARLLGDLTAVGLHIAPLTQLQETYPDWQRKIWDLDWDFAQDEPQPVTINKLPLEQYVKQTFQGPGFQPDLWFVALDNGRFVGLSQFMPVENEPYRLRTGMTGVARSHRRRGLATALKVKSIDSARRSGILTVRTGTKKTTPCIRSINDLVSTTKLLNCHLRRSFEHLP